MWPSFRAIGRGTSENAWRNKKKKEKKHHEHFIRPPVTTVNGRPKNHDVTIITSLGHVTSSGAWQHAQTIAHWHFSIGCPAIGTIPSSGFVSEIISPKVATNITTWWRHQWRHIARIDYTWGQYHTGEHCRRTSILHKNHDVTIMTSYGVTWRHREHDQSIRHGHFPTIHTGTICNINYQHIARIPVCVGDRWGVVGEGHMTPSQKSGKIFFGQLSRKIRAFC